MTTHQVAGGLTRRLNARALNPARAIAAPRC